MFRGVYQVRLVNTNKNTLLLRYICYIISQDAVAIRETF